MSARLFASFAKDAAAGEVHVTTALGNERRGRGKAKPFRAFIAGRKNGAGSPQSWSVPLAVAKAYPEQRLIFGWASVVAKDGQAIIDKQGDIIPIAELEKAAYDFVLHSREHGAMHLRKGTGRLIESMVFTREKQAALGIDLGQEGWWVGFRVDDDAVWASHKRGELPELSIGGRAIAEPSP